MSGLQPWHKDQAYLQILYGWLESAEAEAVSSRMRAEGDRPLRLIRTPADTRVFARYPLDFIREWRAHQRWLAEISAEAM